MINKYKLSAMFKFFKDVVKKRGGDPSYLENRFGLGPRCNTIPNAKGKFGYDKSKPIPVCLPNGQMEYLRSLRCKCGEPFEFRRLGSDGTGQDGHVIDGFKLVCKARRHQITLYMDMYHLGSASLVPKKLRKVDG